MICYAERKSRSLEGANIRYTYRCELADKSWTADVFVDFTDLNQSEMEREILVYGLLATAVSAQASADVNFTITVTPDEIII